MRSQMSVALLCVCAIAAPAAAQADDAVAAKAQYESGVRHYDLSEWDPALADFKEAYRNKPDPVFLYNIAQCHRKLGHTDEAITFYQTYLRRAPDAKNREEVERRITELQAVRGGESTAGATGGKAPPPPVTVEAPRQAVVEAAPAPSPAAAQPVPIPSAPPGQFPATVAPPAEPPYVPAAPSGATPHPSAAPASVSDYPQSPPPTPMPSTPAALDFSARDQAVPEASSPVYGRWWFWTAVGAVAAGGATVAIIMARRDPTNIPSSGLGAQKAFP